MASPSEYGGAYDGSGSPLPSPGFGGFGSPYASYAHAHAQGGSPYASPAALYEGAGGDYLSARAVRVKQEERDGEDALGLGLEGFYAALEGAAASGSHHHQAHHPHGHHGLASYASSSSLSSSSSASSSTSDRPDTARQGPRPPPSSVGSVGSVGSSPAGSPCVGTFWAAGQLEQARAEQQLPSPPQSPPYYGEVIHSSHHADYAHAQEWDAPHQHQQHAGHDQQQQQQQLYGWLADGTVSSVGEMSNGQYYAALQSPHHLHDAHSQQQQQQQQQQQLQGEFFSYQHGGVYA
jgi:hypothetical protein